jgi:hypothetical protein
LSTVPRAAPGVAALTLAALGAFGLAQPPVAAPQAPPGVRVDVPDVQEGGSRLDLREADSAFEGGALRFTFVTWSRWHTRAIRDRGFLVVDVDPHLGQRYRVVVRSNGHRLKAVLYLKRGGRDKPLRRLRAWRRDHFSASVRVAASRVGLALPGQYEWRAQTLYTSKRCKQVCLDRAPEQGDALVTLPPV